MSKWIETLIHPLGLVGFTLFLMFGLYSKLTRTNERHRWTPILTSAAAIALIAGVGLAYLQVRRPPSEIPQKDNHAAKSRNQATIHQASSGSGSPNIQGIEGTVTITIDQSRGKHDVGDIAGPNSQKKEYR